MKMISNSSFDIHIFGDGSGETIFLEFENNKIGIIDFGFKNFTDWLDKYLKENELSTIEFLMWTHPHDDHTRYLQNLLIYIQDNNITVKNFFRFPYRKFKSLSTLMDMGLKQKCTIKLGSPYLYTEKTSPKYLYDLCEKLEELKTQNLILNFEHIQFASEIYPLNKIQKDISIHCIAPTQKEIDKYEEIIDNCLHKKLDTSEVYPDSNKHNIISIAIVITFGNNNIILGGDVENTAWANSMTDERFKNYTCCKLAFLKAPHHGSETAYNEQNWKNWGTDYLVVITPYNKVNLPKIDGIQKILNHTKNIHILKDVHKHSLLRNHLAQFPNVLKTQEEITTAENVTNHLKITLYNDGVVNSKWLSDL